MMENITFRGRPCNNDSILDFQWFSLRVSGKFYHRKLKVKSDKRDVVSVSV